MKYDITHALILLKPGAEWTLRGSDYSGLEWFDSNQRKPTEIIEYSREIIRHL